MAIYYRNFKNVVIDGGYFLQDLFASYAQRLRDQYEARVVEQLNQAWATWTGWAVLRSIIDTHKTLTIVPFSSADQRRIPDAGAYVRPVGLFGALNGAPAGEERFLGRDDDPSTPEDERYQMVPLGRGTGRGTDAEMHYTAEKMKDHPEVKSEDHDDVPRCPQDGTVATGPCRLGPLMASYGPDSVLVHELVHALRFMCGFFNQVPTWYKRYDNEEEYFAILVSNIYISEKGRKLLAANHHGWAALREELSTSEGFLGKGAARPSRDHLENRRLVQKFVCQNHRLSSYLSGKVNGAFNPIREFMRNSQRYPLYPR
jgi:hypothetical protein